MLPGSVNGISSIQISPPCLPAMPSHKYAYEQTSKSATGVPIFEMYRHLMRHSCLFSFLDGGFEIHQYCCLQHESIHSHCGIIFISLHEYTPRLWYTVLLTGIQAAYTLELLRTLMLHTFIRSLNEHIALAR